MHRARMGPEFSSQLMALDGSTCSRRSFPRYGRDESGDARVMVRNPGQLLRAFGNWPCSDRHPASRMSAEGPGCSLTRGLDVKLSFDVPAGFTVLSAVGAVPSA